MTTSTTSSWLSMAEQATTTDNQQEWIKRIAEHQDRKAFAQLFRYFAPRLLSHARRHFNNEALAEEMVQETMTKVWLKAHLYHRSKGQVSTWLFTVARNVRFDMLRRIQARPEQLCGDDIYLDMEADSEVLGDSIDGGVLRQQLSVYCSKLPKAQRQVVEMIYFEDRSQQEVADALSIPIGTVKSRLRLALSKIREQLNE